ncbi:MAG: hypothetical protein WCS94_09620 [Verrucomicrobiota bacterium]
MNTAEDCWSKLKPAHDPQRALGLLPPDSFVYPKVQKPTSRYEVTSLFPHLKILKNDRHQSIIKIRFYQPAGEHRRRPKTTVALLGHIY